MDVRAIRTAADHEWALAEIAPYFDTQPPPGTPEADRFDVLADLIAAYEDRQHPIPVPDPVDLLRAHMETTGRSQSDLAALLGSRSRASEVLGRRRGLTVRMIHKISSEWHIPADCLVVPYRVTAAG